MTKIPSIGYSIVEGREDLRDQRSMLEETMSSSLDRAFHESLFLAQQFPKVIIALPTLR